MRFHLSPTRVPREWVAEQCRLARSPGYLEAHLTALRALVGPFGQRELLVDRLGLLGMPTLVVWGNATGLRSQLSAIVLARSIS